MTKLGSKTACTFCGTEIRNYSQHIRAHWLECKRVRLKTHDEIEINGETWARDYWEALTKRGKVESDQWPVLDDDGTVILQPMDGDNKVVQYKIPLPTPEEEELQFMAAQAAEDQVRAKWIDDNKFGIDQFVAELEAAGVTNISYGFNSAPMNAWYAGALRFHVRGTAPNMDFFTKGYEHLHVNRRVYYTLYGGRFQGQYHSRLPGTVSRLRERRATA